MATTFVASSPFPNTQIVQDATKGRCLITTVPILCGTVIFHEEALIYASYKDEGSKKHLNAELLKEAFGKKNYKMIEDVHEELSQLEKFDSLDTARNFLQLVAIFQQKDSLVSSGKVSMQQMALLSQLTANQLTECVADIRRFRQVYSKFLPKSLTDAQAGMVLGIINTNQLELGDYGWLIIHSRLFVFLEGHGST